MIYFIIFLILVVFFSASFLMHSLSLINFTLKLERLRRKLKLNIDKGGIFKNPFLYGRIKGKKITISKQLIGKVPYLNINIRHKINISGDMCISKETAVSKIKKTFGKNDIKTYYGDFDDRINLNADNAVNLIALLNRNAINNILLINNNADLNITRESISIDVKMSLLSGKINAISSLINQAVSLSGNLTGTKSIKQRLIDNINDIARDGVRINNLNYLVDNFAGDKEMKNFLKTLLDDSSVEMQITVAKHLKNEGLEHLHKLLKNQKKNNNYVSTDIIKFFGEKRYKKAVPLLIGIYKESEKFTEMDINELKIIILSALKDIADPSASDFLIRELNNDDNKFRDEAIKALASCGDKKALEPLIILGKFVMQPYASNLIHDAIGRIRLRLDPVDADYGALSVAEQAGEDGALSITDDSVQGGLSMAEEKNKEKKLSQEQGGV